MRLDLPDIYRNRLSANSPAIVSTERSYRVQSFIFHHSG